MGSDSTLRYLFFNYYIMPTVLVLFTIATMFGLAIVGQGHDLTAQFILEILLGDQASWKCVLIFYAWTIMWLKMPFKVQYGAETKFGTRACLRTKGFLYYCTTLAAFLLLQLLFPNLSTWIYINFLKLLGVSNIIGIILCVWLYIKGKWKPDHPEDPDHPRGSFIYEFFAGVELQPRLFGCDMKQLAYRIGFMTWQLLICAFFLTGLKMHGFNTASLVHLLIQSVHSAKFFYWEAGYCFSFDMYDKLGFHLFWGCIVGMPSLFTFATNYSTRIPPTLSPITSILIGIFGLACTLLNYKIPKRKFLDTTNYECVIWGKPAKYILAEYKDLMGTTKKTALLTSGFWGLGRHMNYTSEIGAAFAFCATLGFVDGGLWNFVYFFYTVLYIPHRLFRDEEKNRKKYGEYWKKYCSQVPYKMIPGLW